MFCGKCKQEFKLIAQYDRHLVKWCEQDIRRLLDIAAKAKAWQERAIDISNQGLGSFNAGIRSRRLLEKIRDADLGG